MGISTLLCCLLWATISSVIEAQSPSFLITAPRLLHLGVGEDVWVQVEWPQAFKASNSDIKVEMYLRNQKNYAECTTRYTATLNNRNSYITKQTIELTPERAKLCKLNEKRSERYVQLVVSSASISAKPQVVSIPVAYKRGYIFIQTDKSIYTPKETDASPETSADPSDVVGAATDDAIKTRAQRTSKATQQRVMPKKKTK